MPDAGAGFFQGGNKLCRQLFAVHGVRLLRCLDISSLTMNDYGESGAKRERLVVCAYGTPFRCHRA